MRDQTKIKYLKVLSVHGEIIKSFGSNAPYISKEHIIRKVIKELREQGIKKVSRIVVYRALKKSSELKNEEYMLG